MGKRLFIALELPEDCRERLAGLATVIRGVRWLTADQIHLTLAFMGDVSVEAETGLQEKLTAVRVPPFLLSIKGLGTFGGSRPSVIWTGVGTPHPHLFALHRQIHDALLAARFDPELRAFHPHVTIARLKNVSVHTLRPFLLSHESKEFCDVEVTSFALVSSKPGPAGSVYTVDRRYGLTVPA